MDIDVDIEKKIAQLQEGRINGSIKPITKISIDPDKQIKEWNLEKGFESFLTNIEIKKEDLGKKIAEEEKKINALEGLFTELTNTKKPKKKKELLAEPEKLKLKVEPNDKPIDPQPPVDISPIKEEKIVLDPEAQRLVLERYGQLNQGFPLPKEVESDPDIVNKVMSHIKEMKVANELEKEKMTGLKSIDTLEKLTREFLNFKHVTNMQMGTIGGGGGVQLLDMDDVNISTKANGYILKYNASTERMDFVDPSSLNSTLVVADGGTIGSTTTTDAITIAADGDVTLKGDLTVEGTTTSIDSTTIQIQNSFKFEGATADAHETNLTTIDPTADRTISLPNVSGTLPVLAAVSATQITSTPEELNILDGVTTTAAEINLIDGGTSRGTTAVADADGILHNDNGTMRMTSAATFKTYFQAGISSAADDISAGDAAVNITTSSGNITIDAAANDSDVIFKGTDDSSDITMLTLDGSDAGSATFNDKVIVGDGKLVLNSTAVTSTAAELNLLDGVSGLVQADLTKLAAVDSTAAELNIVDGGTSATSTTVADADRVVLNDNGTMVQVAVTDLAAYFDDEITAMGNLVETGALDAGSITSGFGTIDTGSSAITTTGLISGGSLDIDNVLINGTTIGHTDDTDLMTVADGLLTVAGEVSMTTLDIGGTNVTATAAELNHSDGVTSAIQTQMDTKTTKGFAIASAIVFG